MHVNAVPKNPTFTHNLRHYLSSVNHFPSKTRHAPTLTHQTPNRRNQGPCRRSFGRRYLASAGVQRSGAAGEIDLIVADAATLVFVEVKARKTFDEAAYAVLPTQQLRLLQAADSALALHQEWNRPNIRFDVALVCGGAVRHIHDAIRYA
jgi:Holliday junction resolvase-like predicted endonuclease